MFCHKCGAQIAEGAAFCHKCGTKVVYVDTDQQSVDTPTPVIEPQTEINQQIPATPVYTDTALNSESGFKMFINNHIQATTEYQSAEELFNSCVQQKFVWLCFGIPIIFSIIQLLRSFSLANLIGAVGFTLLIGFIAAYLCDFIFATRAKRQISKNAIKFSENIDTDDLVSFLNRQLGYLSPWFHEWRRIVQSGTGVSSTIAANAINEAAERANEITLGTGFGRKPKCLATIYIKNDVTAPNAGYSIGASGGILPVKYACVVRAAPVLQAAMEYYLKTSGGKRIVGISMEQPTEAQQASLVQQTTLAPTDSPERKKFKLPIIVGVAAIAVIALAVFVALNWGGKTDYVATVRAYTPYANSQGIPYTCGEVFDQYIPDADWKVRESGDVHYVDIGGIANGTDKELAVTIQVKAEEDLALMEPVSITLGGEELTDDAFFALFVAYDEKDDNLSNIEDLINEVEFALRGGELLGKFSDEATGISFSYPDWWAELDTPGEHAIVDIISPRNNGNHTTKFDVMITFDTLDVFSGDEAAVKNSLGEDCTLLDYGDVMLGDIPAKALSYQTKGLNGDDVVVTFWYMIGKDVYRVACSYAASTSAIYEPIFDSIMESYTATTIDLCYKGVSLTSCIGSSADSVYDVLGWPDYGTAINGYLYEGGEYFGYNNGTGSVSFIIDYQTGTIGWINGAAGAIEVNGSTLDMSRGELINLFGTPESEVPVHNEMEWPSDYYVIDFIIDGISIQIKMPDINSNATSVLIYK